MLTTLHAAWQQSRRPRHRGGSAARRAATAAPTGSLRAHRARGQAREFGAALTRDSTSQRSA